MSLNPHGRRLLTEYAIAAMVWSAMATALLLQGVEPMDSTGFMTRGNCGGWNNLALNVYVVSNLMTFVAYAGISICLIVDTGGPSHQFSPEEHAALRFVFGVFIAFCGIVHLEGVISFGWPAYHLFSLWHLAVALVSWVAFFAIFRRRLALLSVI